MMGIEVLGPESQLAFQNAPAHVRRYADELFAQARGILDAHGVSSMEEFIARVESGQVPIEQADRLQTVFAAYSRALETGKAPMNLARLALTETVTFNDGVVGGLGGELPGNLLAADVGFWEGSVGATARIIDMTTGQIDERFLTGFQMSGVLGVTPDDRVIVTKKHESLEDVSTILWNPFEQSETVVWKTKLTADAATRRFMYNPWANMLVCHQDGSQLVSVYDVSADESHDITIPDVQDVFGVTGGNMLVIRNGHNISYYDMKTGKLADTRRVNSMSFALSASVLADGSIVYVDEDGALCRWRVGGVIQEFPNIRWDRLAAPKVVSYPDDSARFAVLVEDSQAQEGNICIINTNTAFRDSLLPDAVLTYPIEGRIRLSSYMTGTRDGGLLVGNAGRLYYFKEQE